MEFTEADVASLAAHPGVSATELGDHLFGGNPVGRALLEPLKLLSRLVLSSAEDGCRPTLRAATDPQAEGGDYFGPSGIGEVRGRPTRVEATAAARREADAARLWEASESLTGVSFL